MLEKTLPRTQRFIAARLSPQGEFGLHLTVGITLMLLATWAFGFIADEVAEGAAITGLDVQLANWLHAHASAGLTRVMLVITYIHGMPGIAAPALLLAWWLYRQRERDWLLALAVSVPGAMLLNVLLKQVFQRPRPHFADALLTLDSYSFPSGHTVSATVLYGFLACYLASQTRSRAAAVLAFAGAALMVALVGLSRMYLGVHYLSDVLGAVAEGCAWLAVCIAGVSTLRRRRMARGAR